jgi:hypothetical protein
MKRKSLGILFGCLCMQISTAWAGVDLVTLPGRESVQLTIYNSADLTLVREVRRLTLRKGLNRLSFGWANTLIDPTSLDIRAIDRPDAVRLLDVSYPPRISTQAIWTVESEIEGEVPVEITFFTSGIRWRAFYVGTLSPDEKSMRLQGYVLVTNRSGEDYEDAQTRLVVGKIHLLDRIAELARRSAPYGRPMALPREEVAERRKVYKTARMLLERPEAVGRPKEILKEGISEYYLYTIEGTETIPDGWSKRLPSFNAVEVPVVGLYRYEEERFGEEAIRFLSFKNDKEHNLGETPLPEGSVKIFRQVDPDGHLSYQGEARSKYIPVGQKVEWRLGPEPEVTVRPRMMRMRTENFSFNKDRNIDGWEELQDWEVEVKNHRDAPARVEIIRNLKHGFWKLTPGKEIARGFYKEDMDTVKFVLDLSRQEHKRFRYILRYYEGERRLRR